MQLPPEAPFIKMNTEITKNTKKVVMKAGRRYKLCTCGESKILPFCDDSHRELNEKEGTNYKSIKISPEEDATISVNSNNWCK